MSKLNIDIEESVVIKEPTLGWSVPEAKEKEEKPKKKDETPEEPTAEKPKEEEPKEEFLVIPINGSINAQMLHGMFNKITSNVKTEDRKRILMNISSPGGSLVDGSAMIGMVKMWDKPIVTISAGRVCSMAINMTVCGDLRLGVPGSRYMIHAPYHPGLGGDIDELRKDIKNYEELETEFAEYLCDRIGLTKAEFRRLQNGDNWFGTTAALNLGTKGIIDGIILRMLDGHKYEILMRDNVIKVVDIYNDDLTQVKNTTLEQIEKTTKAE